MNLDTCVQRATMILSREVRQRFPADPLAVMRTDLGLIVQAAEHLAEVRRDGGACDGVSFLKDGVILYAPTHNSRRENFTLAHELGHWLAEQDGDIYDWLADQEEPGRLLETVCDRIAQGLLLPESIVDTVLNGEPVRAEHLARLYDASQASRPVCAIALAKRLPGLGAIAIVDRDRRTVTHASITPDPHEGWPKVYPWPGQELSDTHPLLLLAPGATFTRRSRWAMSWGTSTDYYIDAIADVGRVTVVFSDTDVWNSEAFHPPIDREFDTRPHLTVHCCGTTSIVRGYPCETCDQGYCPRCGRCHCERQAMREMRCSRCFLTFAPHLVVDGLCQDCQDQ